MQLARAEALLLAGSDRANKSRHHGKVDLSWLLQSAVLPLFRLLARLEQ